MRFKDGEYLFVVWDRLALEKMPVDLVDLPHSVLEEVRDLIDLPGWFPLCDQFQKECFNLNSAVGARQSSGKLLMLNQCLCLKSSTMTNPFGEAL